MHMFSKRASLQELGNEIFKLVSYGATPEQWAEWLRVPLEHAVARGNLDLVNTLLQAGADGSAGWRGCRGRTLLHAAAVGGNPDVLTALLRAGAQPDVNVVSLSPKRSALYVATVCGHEEVARDLLLAGADVRLEDLVDQCSVLHEAADGGHEQLVKDLLIGGADPNSVDGRSGWTPLHQAASAGHAGIISALLLRGADKDALDVTGTSPLYLAAANCQSAAADILAAANSYCGRRGVHHMSPLDMAVVQGCLPVLKAILRHGVNVDTRQTALTMAAGHNQPDAIDVLVDDGADIEPDTHAGFPALLSAAFSSHCEAMLALLKRGASARISDALALTPLHHACLGKAPGLERAVDLLLRWGADETALQTGGRRPAELLDFNAGAGPWCSQEDVERVRLLLARAPADRAWRRRGWLLMLRSRASEASGENRSDGGISGDVSDTNVVGDGGQPKCPSGTTSDGSRGVQHRGGGTGVASDGGDLSRLVALLAGLEMDGVFRAVVGFV